MEDEVLADDTFAYTVIEGEEGVLTTLTLSSDKSSVPSGEKIEFTAKGQDQYSSPVNLDGADGAEGKLEWFVNGKKQADITGSTFTLEETEPGDYTVQIFSKDNPNVYEEATVTVGAAELTNLTVTSTGDVVTANNKRFNNEEVTFGTIEPNEGAALLAKNIKFNVTSSDKDLTAEDITVTATEETVGKGDAVKEVIVLKATSTKAGSFKITPFVGESFTAEDIIKAAEQTVTTTVNQEVASISDITFEAKELKVGSEVKKEIVIKNKRGELLTDADLVDVNSTKLDVLKAEDAKIVSEKDEDGVTKIYLSVKATAAGNLVNSVVIDKKDVKPLYSTEKADEDFVGNVVVEALASKVGGGTTTDTVTLNFDNKVSKAAIDTVKLVQTVEGKEVDVESLEVSEETTITLSAKDQYDTEFDFDGKNVQVLVGDSTVVSAKNETNAGTIKLTPESEGSTTVSVIYNGKTITVPVTVKNDEAKVTEATTAVTTAETQKTDATRTEAQEKVTDLLNGTTKTDLQARIDAIVTAEDEAEVKLALPAPTVTAADAVGTGVVATSEDTTTAKADTAAVQGVHTVTLNTDSGDFVAGDTITIDSKVLELATGGDAAATAGVEFKEGTKDLNTITVTAGATAAGTLNVVFNDGTITDKTIEVYVLATDTAVKDVAAKIAAKLKADSDINAAYDIVDVEDGTITVTDKTAAENKEITITIQISNKKVIS